MFYTYLLKVSLSQRNRLPSASEIALIAEGRLCRIWIPNLGNNNIKFNRTVGVGNNVSNNVTLEN